MKNRIAKGHIIFSISIYALIEIILYYLIPVDFTYKYLKLTNFGIFYFSAVFLPFIVAGISAVFYKRFRTNLYFIILVICIIGGICIPFISALYPVTISETTDINDYKHFDPIGTEKENLIKGLLPDTLPEDNVQAEYHYRYAKEGFEKGLQISLTLHFIEKTDYLNWEKGLEHLEIIEPDEIACEITADKSLQAITYLIKY